MPATLKLKGSKKRPKAGGRIGKLFAKPRDADYRAAAKVIAFWRRIGTAYSQLHKRRHRDTTAERRFDGLVAALSHYDSASKRGVTLLLKWLDPASDPERGAELVEKLALLIALYREASDHGGGIADVDSEIGAPGMVEYVAKMMKRTPKELRSALIKRERVPRGVARSGRETPKQVAMSMLTGFGMSGRSTVLRRRKLRR